MFGQQAKPRGGGQASASDDEPRAEAVSRYPHTSDSFQNFFRLTKNLKLSAIWRTKNFLNYHGNSVWNTRSSRFCEAVPMEEVAAGEVSTTWMIPSPGRMTP